MFFFLHQENSPFLHMSIKQFDSEKLFMDTFKYTFA
jgi:hypothetical protein